MADGILSLATVIMAGAIKQISIEHGLDPREFVLFCYGGGGPLHAGALARELSIPTVVIPPEPGNFSAVGMLLADARLDLSKTFVGVLADRTVDALKAAFAEMEAEARAALVREFDANDVLFERHAEMRYAGQRHNIKVPISGLDDAAGIREAFDRDYKRRYGHADAKAAAELQALHLSAFTRLRPPELARLPRPHGSLRAPQRRPVYFGTAGGTLAAQIYDRIALAPGFAAAGPALIEEYGSTTLIWPGDRFEIGALGEIRIRCGRG
jgi:N-methylhydantoinase A